MTNDQIKHD